MAEITQNIGDRTHSSWATSLADVKIGVLERGVLGVEKSLY